MREYSIGIDLGGTNLKAAAFDGQGGMLHKIARPTPTGEGSAAILNRMVKLIAELQAKVIGGHLLGVGVGVPGFVLMKQGVVAGSANLPELDHYPVREELAKVVNVPVFLENDANAAMLGERWRGAGRGVDDLVLMTLGTGVGGGILVDGRVLHGHLGMAGELGHLTVSPNGYPCGCGNVGCLEKYASATAVSAMARLLNLGANLTAEEVYHLAQDGNQRALTIFQSVGTALGTALATLINIFNFPLYLLGGGMTEAWDLFAPAMREEIARRSFSYRTHPPQIARATLGGDAGLYGAAYLALEGRR